MEQPPDMSSLDTFLSVQTALNAVRKEGKGQQLGWVIYRPSQLDDYPSIRADWESCCEKQCEKLRLSFQDVRDSLGWTAGLLKAIDKGHGTFCYGALHEFLEHDRKHVHLVLQQTTKPGKGDEKRKREIATSLTDLSMDLILSCCTPIPYGNLLMGSTKVDTQVGRALEAHFEVQLDYGYRPPNRYSFGYGGQEDNYPRPIFKHRLKEAVRKYLSHGQDVKLVPSKLNVYGEGDSFQPQTDTPVDAKYFIGTVVMCLPSKFSGGELVVSHGDTCQTFDFAATSGEPGMYQFAIFYGDCVHTIKPVTMGRRVTLTYHILRTTGDNWEGDEEPGEDWPSEDAMIKVVCILTVQKVIGPVLFEVLQVHKQLRPFYLKRKVRFPAEALSLRKLKGELKNELLTLSKRKYPYVGFLLQHEYTSGLTPEGLKGTDKFLYDLILEEGWSVRFFSVLVIDEENEDVGREEPNFQSSDFSRRVFSFTKHDFTYLKGEGEGKPHHGFHTDIPFMWYGAQPAGRVLDKHSIPGGFQACNGDSVPSQEQIIYLQSAMIVDLQDRVKR